MIKDKSRFAFMLISYTVIIVFCLICFIPFYLVLVASFTSERAILTQGFNLFVTSNTFSLDGYKAVLERPIVILRAYGVTIFVTIVGTLCSIFLTVMTGFVLSRKDFPWRNPISFFFFFTTLFNGGLVPWYLLCVNVLMFTNRIYALILPTVFSVWNLIIAKNFMKTIPFAIIESCKIDGAGEFSILLKFIFPLSKPLIATIGLFTALNYWNDWFHSMLFMRDESMYTLQYLLQNIFSGTQALRRIAELSGRNLGQLPMESMKMAMLIVTTGPIVFLYPFLQKYFVKGLMIGSVKG